MALGEQQYRYRYADYLTWSDEERWEILDGKAYAMVPAPNIQHQSISILILGFLIEGLRGGPCTPFHAPTDVVLDEFNVVQPDLLVVCDQEKIGAKNIQGAPSLVFEILSPSTGARDRTTKLAIYERFGVETTVLVHPQEAYVEVFRLLSGKYAEPEILTWQQELVVKKPALSIPLWTVFARDQLGTEPCSPQPEPQ